MVAGTGTVERLLSTSHHNHLTTFSYIRQGQQSFTAVQNSERCFNSGSAMLQELSHMDRITQLQNEIEQVRRRSPFTYTDSIDRTARQLLTIMSSSIAYLTSRTNFEQVSEAIPITKQRNPEKVDAPDVFESVCYHFCF